MKCIQMQAHDWVKHLDLLPHPEGGYYQETYRCQETLTADNLPERFEQEHCFSTAIYYLLEAPDFSAFHRIKQDELWHFYSGNSGLTIHIITASGNYQALHLGNEPNKHQAFQHTVKAGDWFAANVTEPDGYALVGCTVAPGFEFADFELAKCKNLSNQFPQHEAIINQFTRN